MRALVWQRVRTPSRWTLRTRLLALTLLLLAAVAVVIATVSALSLRGTLVAQVDTQLRAATGFVDAPGRGDRGPAASDPTPSVARFLRYPGQRSGTVGALVAAGAVRDSARLVPAGPDTAAPPLSTAQAQALLADASPVAESSDGDTTDGGGGLGAQTSELPGLGRFRVASVDLSDGSTLVIGLPLADSDAAIAHLVSTEALVAGIGLAVVGIVGNLLLRSALRPLTRVAATAGRVSELRLDRGEVTLADRVPDADTDPRTEVGQVGLALNRMLGHVSTALSVRQESESRVRAFVADASHELRTPLAAIRGYAELTRRSRESVPEDVAFSMRRVESEAQRMTSLVEDMLLLARLDSGRPLELDEVDLSELVVDVASDAHAAGPDHPLSLQLPDEPLLVPGDPARLHQVLANLLANARAHTPPGTPVTVSLSHAEREAMLAVADDGPGIDPELLPEVFVRFARGDTSRARAAGSTGLGLAIVSAVVTAHHGRVEVSSRPGRTVFTVWLPEAGQPARRSSGV